MTTGDGIFWAAILFTAVFVFLLSSNFQKEKRRAHWTVTGFYTRNKPKKGSMINARCNTKQEVVLSLSPVDSEGAPVILDDDAVKLTVVDGSSTGTVNRADDGSFEIVLRSAASPGKTTFRLEADALPGEGVEILPEDLTLDVVSVAAVSLGIAIKEVRQKSPT